MEEMVKTNVLARAFDWRDKIILIWIEFTPYDVAITWAVKISKKLIKIEKRATNGKELLNATMNEMDEAWDLVADYKGISSRTDEVKKAISKEDRVLVVGLKNDESEKFLKKLDELEIEEREKLITVIKASDDQAWIARRFLEVWKYDFADKITVEKKIWLFGREVKLKDTSWKDYENLIKAREAVGSNPKGQAGEEFWKEFTGTDWESLPIKDPNYPNKWNRYVDAYDDDLGIIYEIKNYWGKENVTASSQIREEISNDIWLLNNNPDIKKSIRVFTDKPPTSGLKDRLEKAGIEYIIFTN